MNLLQIINDLKQIAAECDKVTSGNVSHKIANIEQGILNITYYLEHYCELGWHPASELPPVDKFGESKYLIAYDIYGYAFSAFYSRKKGWCDDDGRDNLEIEWWCYSPREED